MIDLLAALSGIEREIVAAARYFDGTEPVRGRYIVEVKLSNPRDAPAQGWTSRASLVRL